MRRARSTAASASATASGRRSRATRASARARRAPTATNGVGCRLQPLAGRVEQVEGRAGIPGGVRRTRRGARASRRRSSTPAGCSNAAVRLVEQLTGVVDVAAPEVHAPEVAGGDGDPQRVVGGRGTTRGSPRTARAPRRAGPDRRRSRRCCSPASPPARRRRCAGRGRGCARRRRARHPSCRRSRRPRRGCCRASPAARGRPAARGGRSALDRRRRRRVAEGDVDGREEVVGVAEHAVVAGGRGVGDGLEHAPAGVVVPALAEAHAGVGELELGELGERVARSTGAQPAHRPGVPAQRVGVGADVLAQHPHLAQQPGLAPGRSAAGGAAGVAVGHGRGVVVGGQLEHVAERFGEVGALVVTDGRHAGRAGERPAVEVGRLGVGVGPLRPPPPRRPTTGTPGRGPRRAQKWSDSTAGSAPSCSSSVPMARWTSRRRRNERPS